MIPTMGYPTGVSRGSGECQRDARHADDATLVSPSTSNGLIIDATGQGETLLRNFSNELSFSMAAPAYLEGNSGSTQQYVYLSSTAWFLADDAEPLLHRRHGYEREGLLGMPGASPSRLDRPRGRRRDSVLHHRGPHQRG